MYIVVNDKMQSGYQYELTEGEGENFATEFTPQLTPQQMLELGVFGGKYLTDCLNEFPSRWFLNAKLSPNKKDISLNYFKVDASQSLNEWQKKGWIVPQDPRGWFQWYCRYYLGRRSHDDARQIQRWKNFRRHWFAVVKQCEFLDHSCRKKQRQALLHWAYDSRAI